MNKARELAELLLHKHLLEQIKYGDLDGIVHDITGAKGKVKLIHLKMLGNLKLVQMIVINVTYSKLTAKVLTQPSFMFKSSKMAARLALKMDIGLQQDEEPSTMVDEYAYMDAMHTHVKGYKTLTFWTYHHGMCHVMHLNTECFTLFLTLWNNLLAEVSGIPGY